MEPGVDTGIVIHLAFMLDGLIKQESHRQFEKLSISQNLSFGNGYRSGKLDGTRTKISGKIPEDDIAFLTQMFLENKIK